MCRCTSPADFKSVCTVALTTHEFHRCVFVFVTFILLWQLLFKLRSFDISHLFAGRHAASVYDCGNGASWQGLPSFHVCAESLVDTFASQTNAQTCQVSDISTQDLMAMMGACMAELAQRKLAPRDEQALD